MNKRQMFLALGGLVVLIVSGFLLNQPTGNPTHPTTPATGIEIRTTVLPSKDTRQIVLQDLGMT